MNAEPLRSIEHAVFRANPAYELVLFDRLPPEQQAMLNGLRNDPEHYGLLRPLGPSAGELGVKAVCRDIALLFLTLREPGPLPSYVKHMLGEACNQEVAELVLDGILEVGHAGAFVTRADAYTTVYGARVDDDTGGAVARLSREALKYAQALDVDDPLRLSARMYFYHRLPASPDWRRRLATPDAVATYLGTAPGQPGRAALDRDWSPVALAPPYDGWQMWRRRREHDREKAVADSPIAYKLYVSPRTEQLAEAFTATCDAALEANAPRFKVGKDVYGLLRPDKVVVYFSRIEDLQAAADRLHRRLAGCPAHGVPFTAELDSDGLLSWGTDPPRDAQMLDWQERESWRLWLTNRLATALVAARASRSQAVEPWRFALERVRLEGVDTRTWTPDPAIWGAVATASARESEMAPSARARPEHPDADHR